MTIAAEKGIKSIAFPNISTGVYGFPKQRAAIIAVHTIKEFLKENSNIEKVIFAVFDQENYDLYQKLLK